MGSSVHGQAYFEREQTAPAASICQGRSGLAQRGTWHLPCSLKHRHCRWRPQGEINQTAPILACTSASLRGPPDSECCCRCPSSCGTSVQKHCSAALAGGDLSPVPGTVHPDSTHQYRCCQEVKAWRGEPRRDITNRAGLGLFSLE